MSCLDLHHVGAVESDGITAPDVLGVQLGNLDVLDDDVVLVVEEEFRGKSTKLVGRLVGGCIFH